MGAAYCRRIFRNNPHALRTLKPSKIDILRIIRIFRTSNNEIGFVSYYPARLQENTFDTFDTS